MPALSSTSLLNTLVARNATATATNATSNAMQVVCAYPVSGQYGPGSRFLYYVLIAACVFARKDEWLKNACLAAALLLPAIAALHGIVLAALHVDGAVDMDVYGAFQLCSIGILVALATINLSETYFKDPRRNIIFLWAILILAGLLSLTVEFFRLKTSDCTHDDHGHPISPDVGEFPYGISCGLICSVDQGPFSRMRGGSANNIYVIPAPDKLAFGVATVLAAACCIPAILLLITVLNKILKINWMKRDSKKDKDKQDGEPAEGTNGATIAKRRRAVLASVFGGAVLAIVIIGERNFFSPQVDYQTEPIAAIGQWAPISGTTLAVLGALFFFLAGREAVTGEANPNASMDEGGTGLLAASSYPVATPGATDMRRSSSKSGGETLSEIVPTTSRPGPGQGHEVKRSWTADANIQKVAKPFTAIGNYLASQFDESEFKSGKAADFPETPGEILKNENLPQIRKKYNRDADWDVTPARRGSPSRAGSFTGSFASGFGVEGSSTMSRAASFPSPIAPPPLPRTLHAATLSPERPSFELQSLHSSSSAGATGGRLRQRGDSLEVPSRVHHSPMQNNPSASAINSIVNIPEGQGSPAIVVSSDPGTSSSAHTPVSNQPASSSPSEPLPTPSTPASPP